MYGIVMGSAGLILAYGISFWRIFKSNPGDQFIECASITVFVFVLTMAAMKIPHFPGWVIDLGIPRSSPPQSTLRQFCRWEMGPAFKQLPTQLSATGLMTS